MKLSKEKLQEIIKEELKNLNEVNSTNEAIKFLDKMKDLTSPGELGESLLYAIKSMEAKGTLSPGFFEEFKEAIRTF